MLCWVYETKLQGIILFCLAMATSFVLQRHRLCPTALEVQQINEACFSSLGKEGTTGITREEFMHWSTAVTSNGQDTTIFDVYKYFVEATGNEAMKKDAAKAEAAEAEHQKKLEKQRKNKAAEEKAKQEAAEEAARLKAEEEATQEAARLKAEEEAAQLKADQIAGAKLAAQKKADAEAEREAARAQALQEDSKK